MSIRIEGEIILLEGDCEVADAEILAAALEAVPTSRVEVSQCRQLHGAVVQALLAFRPRIEGTSPDLFLKEFVFPCLIREERDPKSSPATGDLP